MTPSKPETELSRKIRSGLERLGCWVERLQSGQLRLRSGGYALCCSPGTPDLMILSPVVAFLEVKCPGGKLSPDQVTWHRRATAAGVEVHTVESVEGAALLAKEWFSRRYDRTWDALRLGG